MTADQGSDGAGSARHIDVSPRLSALMLAPPLLCLTVAFCHLSLSAHEIDPTAFYSFGAPEPYIYRILLPALAALLPRQLLALNTHLPFPLAYGADAVALCVDWLALTFACVLMWLSFRRIAAADATHLRRPGVVVPVFLWMVIFDYILVPNDSMYYPYDFLQLLFFASAVWLGVTGRCGYWGLPLLAFVAALNKEDALFIPAIAAIYAAWVGRFNVRLVWSMLAAGVEVVLAKYLSLAVVREIVKVPFASPTLFEDHLAYNLHQLRNPLAWLAWLGAFGGGAFVLAMPLARINRLKFAVVGLMLAYLPVIWVVGEAREVRLMGPLICPVILPVVLTLEAFLYGKRKTVQAARKLALPRLGPMATGSVAVGLVLAVVAAVVAARSPRHPAALASRHAYQDLLGCESIQIHSCKTGDGQDYDCQFTNMTHTGINLSDIRIWNYDADNNLIHQQPIDTRLALAPGRTSHFEFHDVDAGAVHGRLCRVDPQSLVSVHWSDAS